MRIAVVGGGPGGLYFAALAKQLDPGREVVVWERNAADDTFGFGVVFSDETLGGIEAADPVLFAEVARNFARWSDIDVVHRGQTVTSGGHGFAAINRKVLLQLLQRRCTEVGVDVHYSTTAPDIEVLESEFDLVVAADGANSAIRARYADDFRPSLDARGARYMWLGTDKVFDAFTFLIADTEHGPMQVHAYPFSTSRSTFIVEVNEQTWRATGLDAAEGANLPPGVSDQTGIDRIADIFAADLGGARLIANNSKWVRFTVVRNETWHRNNVVLLGDAAHTAHFSIGSGTKLAMEDALSLAACLNENPQVSAALEAYQAEREPVVASTQRAAQASLEWFEDIAHVVGQDTQQFAFNLLTRSRRVTHDNLRLRDRAYVDGVSSWFGEQHGSTAPPLFQPFALGKAQLRNRIVTAPISTDTARDGIPGDEEALWLASTALGGSGLVLAGMTSVSADGRPSEGCAGLYTESQTEAWRAIVDRVHRVSDALIGVQLTHAGAKSIGSEPDPRLVRQRFAEAATRADAAGFDVLELQAGHGHLLSGLLSPLTNPHGGDLHARLRFPLDVLDAVREQWPADKPILVRISAVDWAPGGTTIADAVRIAGELAEHGADAIDVSSGEVVAHERPAYGRSFQTPFAERIRHDTGIPTIAVGGISGQDDATSIVLAGRADLVAIGRAALHDPAWALHAAAELGYRGPGAEWPAHYRAGATPPPVRKSDHERPRLTLRRTPDIHRRWHPHNP
ncbi:FAD-dependent monooxygenase [Pseudonocardia spinosispora]|uniref:oxidoreductase n=1 Tax=Pseudonocardia spinosispora TaxID=103441 RepID=UPI00040E43B6|nr:FAD-dependent monooxygenase [Pseudonocardia spinosispora]